MLTCSSAQRAEGNTNNCLVLLTASAIGLRYAGLHTTPPSAYLSLLRQSSTYPDDPLNTPQVIHQFHPFDTPAGAILVPLP
jgi:hypothetical protein